MAINLEDGMEVVLEGNVDFYVEGGKISLILTAKSSWN